MLTDEYAKIELTNMVFIQNPVTKVLVQDRVKSWKGYPSPAVM